MNKQRLVLEDELRRYFNYTAFRLGQKEIIQDIMNGNDVLGILPTGSGKSICYQLPAILLEGLTIVVSPLISLMIDQVKQLKANNFKSVVALNSFMERLERTRVIQNLHTYKLIYVSPELLQRADLIKHLQNIKVSLFVIDEAHCISQWGHEFRPDYLKLRSTIDQLDNPITLALSATATPHVQDDIITSLGKTNINKRIYPMDRDNIAFCVQSVSDDQEKIKTINNLMENYRVPTLIYFSSRRTAENIAKVLSEKLPSLRIAFYHGGMDQMDRITIQQQFMNDQLDVICCTSAFGMGINKKNIRLIIHYHFPLQIESYIQEVGRAGRDNGESVSLLLFSPNDIHLPLNIIKNELPSESDLSFVFKHLADLYQIESKLPFKDLEMANRFKLSETQWRFLRFQFEKHDMIIQNTIYYEKEQWERAYDQIKALIMKRTLFKEQKLTEMLNWVRQKSCLRKHLFKDFQPSYRAPSHQCCSSCGFNWSEWKPVQRATRDNLPMMWEDKLKRILLIGERQ